MDQKRLLMAIALSIGILLLFDLLARPNQPALPPPSASITAVPMPSAPAIALPGGVEAPAPVAATPAVRLPVAGPRVGGSLSLRGARLDDIILLDYRETVDRTSPQVRLFAARGTPAPYFGQWGWTGGDARVAVPGNDTDWIADGARLAPGAPLTLRWDNGQGLLFEIALALDENFMVTAEQRVINRGAEPVTLLPWARIRREVTPPLLGFFILHEGFTGVLGGRLRELSYADAKEEARKRQGGPALEEETGSGWLGFVDKYWLGALTAVDPAGRHRVAYRHTSEGGADRWQVDLALAAPVVVAPGATLAHASRLFAGAKEVRLLDAYATNLGIPDFDKAIDFGWFYFLTKPFFYAIDFLFRIFGNFGVAILAFTFALKLLFFPLANRAYKSMGRMKVLAPKMQEVRDRYKDDPAKAQGEMMALYRSEKVNPASGCLPILLQIPVFFALYKVLFVTIEMRHAPFVGWIQDLSAPDPTNAFNLFGILPFDPMQWAAFLHLPAWAIFMGITMYAQQKLNPQPPDPIQQKIFQWMPVIFTFMLATFPAGLVIYWTWNNLLSIAQQWWIQRLEARKPIGGAAPPKAPPAATTGGWRARVAKLVKG